MAVPTWVFFDNFESGDLSNWDVSESDTGSQLSVDHYTTLARTPGLPMPRSGAYCARWELSSSTADATFGDGSVDILDGETYWFKFDIWVDPNILTKTTANDIMPLVEFQQAGGTVEFAFGIEISKTNGAVYYKAGVTTPNFTQTGTAPLGVWTTIELKVNIQTAAATGEIEVYITRDGCTPTSSQYLSVGSVQAAGAVGQMIVGTQDKLSTTRGTILMDNFVMDNARIYPTKNRFAETVTMTGNEHVFVGSGTVESVTLSSTAAADNLITIYDTDDKRNYQGSKKLVLSNDTAGEVVQSTAPFDVSRGCYVETTAGTGNPEVTLKIGRANAHFSDGAMRRFALRRSINP